MANRSQGISEFVGQCREELVLRAALAFGALAAAVGLENLAEIRHDQIQSTITGRRRGGQRQAHLEVASITADQAAGMPATAGPQPGVELVPVGSPHEAVDATADHSLG